MRTGGKVESGGSHNRIQDLASRINGVDRVHLQSFAALIRKYKIALRVCRNAQQSSKLLDEVQFLGRVLRKYEVRSEKYEVGVRGLGPSLATPTRTRLFSTLSFVLPQSGTSSECGGFARDSAKVEDQVQLLARTLELVRMD